MDDLTKDRLDLDDEDRLPWLEPAIGYEAAGSGVSPLRVLLVALLGFAVLGLIVAGVMAVRTYMGSGGGQGRLIAAPQGSYKIPAAEDDARKFAGVGDASYATSEGLARDGKIDKSREPETPIAATPAPQGGPRARSEGAAIPARPEPRVTAKVTVAPASATRAASRQGGTAMIQLGAYGSADGARQAWSKLTRRFAYLAPLDISLQTVTVGESELYRLRALAGDPASAQMLCGRLKAAGESCMVVN